MGCGASKLDDLPAVALCRDRAGLLDDAIRLRYELADAHVAYVHALRSVGFSLKRFFDSQPANSPPSPVLPLPTQRKGDPDPGPFPIHEAEPAPEFISAGPAFSSPPHHLSHSSSGSHIHFHSDSDGGSEVFDHDSSPLHDHETHVQYNYNYMRSQPPPASVSYAQNPETSETVQMAESSYGYASNPYPYPYPSPYPYPNYGGGGINNFFGSPPPPAYQGYPPAYQGYPPAYPPPPANRNSDLGSSSRPPPPPSPPRASSWDFLNPFQTYESFYPSPYTPSRDSREVREEEGIPDLEDEEYRQEVVKEVQGQQRFVNEQVFNGNGYSKGVATERVFDEDGYTKEGAKEMGFKGAANVGGGLEYEVHLVDKNEGEKEEISEEGANVAAAFTAGGSVSEVVSEIKAQFDRAAESGNEIAKMLEAGKLMYHRKGAVHKASSRMLNVATPSLLGVASQLSTSKNGESSSAVGEGGHVLLGFEENKGMKAGNLSSTLDKLYIWEKKLYQEVKAEEKLRIILEKKSRKLKHLDERGAEPNKVDATRTIIRKLSTKIKISIQVVNSISNEINKLRDEELWPQLNELVEGLVIMWKVMLECHHSQCLAISVARNLDAIASDGKYGHSDKETTRELESGILNWIQSFCIWVNVQKGYVRALNGWLLKCLLYEPEETPDGIAPFSPGRMGAPPVFVICHQWAHAMDRISGNEVIEAMQALAMSVLQIWDKLVLRQKMMANREMDKMIKVLEREEQRMQKELDMVNKKLVIVSEQSGAPIPGQIVHQAPVTSNSSLQLGLKQVFEAMEKFSADSLKAYEELWQRSEEDRLARENAKVP